MMGDSPNIMIQSFLISVDSIIVQIEVLSMFKKNKKLEKRFISLGLASLFVLTAFVMLVPTVEEADGWTTRNAYAAAVSNGVYLSGGRYRSSSGTNDGLFTSSSIICGRSLTYNYRAFLSFGISGIDEKAYIHSGTLNVRVDHVGYSNYLYAYLLSSGSLSDTEWDSYQTGRYLGAIYVTGDGTGSYSLDIYAIQLLRNAVKNGNSHICVAFRSYESSSSSSINNYLRVLVTSQSHLSLNIDASAPRTPALDDLHEYTEGSSVSLDWDAVSDNPTGGSYGGVRYQAGVFDNKTSAEPVYTSSWSSNTAYTFNSLNDGQVYHFRVRSKDGLGFESSWSALKTTTMDSTAPTQPGILPEPIFTIGTENGIIWNPSYDTASGVDYYTIIGAPSPDFTGSFGTVTDNNYHTFTGLTSGVTYYYVVYATDNQGHVSQLSSIEQSTQDDTPPTAPVMTPEPAYTKGESNRFDWHPSSDVGIGVSDYLYELATTEDFTPGSIVDQGTVTEPYFSMDGLIDGTMYWARVKARDGFDQVSEWSRVEWSIQDISGPGELGLKPLMTYSPEGPIRLEWNGAEDGGAGTGWYKVIWSKDPLFETGINEIDHVVGHSYTISGLDAGDDWFFKVISYDGLGNEGEKDTTSTTIDPDAPTTPVITTLPEFSGGRSTLIGWSASADLLSGLDHYEVNVYTSQDRIGTVFTVRTIKTEFEVPGLSDGTTYYYEVIAHDRAGNTIVSALEHSIQDAKGPTIPNLKDTVGEYSTQGIVPISWEPSTDDGIGDIYYEVQFAINSLFNLGVQYIGTSETSTYLHDTTIGRGDGDPIYLTRWLPDGTYFYHVRARDGYGTLSSYGPTRSVKIDTEDPDPPVISPIETYWGSGKAVIEWGKVNDGFQIEVNYQVSVFEEEDAKDPVITSPWTEELSYEIMGLDGGRDYWIKVTSKDPSGRTSGPSASVRIVMDNTPPRFTIDKGGIFGGADLYISGEAEDSQCGMGIIQISFDHGLNWEDCPLDNGIWSFSIPNAPEGADSFMVRAIDDGENIGDSIHGSIDLSEPEIIISYPPAGSEVSGAVQLIGSITDMNLKNYRVEYLGPAGGDWADIIPMQTTSGFSGILATWITSGLPGGDYTIRVTAEDKLGQTMSEEITLTLAGASIILEPSMVSFSNSHPASGDKVTVFLTLTNLGDSPAEELTVTIFDGEDAIGTTNGVTVSARGSTVVTAEMSASGKHEITARVSSDVIGEIEMTEAAVLETTEDEMLLENFGGMIAIVALILAIIAIILALFFGMKKAKKEEIDSAEPKEAEIREKVEDRKDRGQRAAALGAPSGPQQRAGLPPPDPAKEKSRLPALPNPTIAPVSMPEPRSEPAPMQTTSPTGGVTYMAPNKNKK